MDVCPPCRGYLRPRSRRAVRRRRPRPARPAGVIPATGGPRGRVVFAIDGLQDTLGTYRRNVSFDKVIANASAFIAAGGRAEWDFLVFEHNELNANVYVADVQ